MRYQAVIFDLDNTLLDRKKSINKLSKKLFNKYIQPGYPEQQVYVDLITADGDGYRSRTDRYEYLAKVLPWSTVPTYLWHRPTHRRPSFFLGTVLLAIQTNVLKRRKHEPTQTYRVCCRNCNK